jgi:hypothetical protein
MEILKLFCGYAPEDRGLQESFHAHLRRVLELQQASIWYDQDLLPGAERERERNRQLYAARIILFLISSDFMSRYEKAVLPAMGRYNRGEVRVIPIILRPVDWENTLLGKFQPLPRDGKPVTDLAWHSQDHAFVNIVEGIKRIINEEKGLQPGQPGHSDIPPDCSQASAYTQLEQLIRQFKMLRQQMADYVYMKGARGFTVVSCENQYNKLYGDTMVFLATYLPERVSDDAEGFVEMVYQKVNGELHNRASFTVSLTRLLLPFLGKLEKLAIQIDACTATLELYLQKYLTKSV